MAYRRRSSGRNDEGNKFEKPRQTLPRRCKSNKPFYGVDIDEADEKDDNLIPRRKREIGSSSTIPRRKGEIGSSSTIPRRKREIGSSSTTRRSQGSLGGQPKRKVEANSIEKPEENAALSNSPFTVLSWLIEMKTVKENDWVYCFTDMRKTFYILGKIKQGGIHCQCCDTTVSPSYFLSHRSGLWLERPYENIFLAATNVSLSIYEIEAWNRHSLPARSGYQHVVRRPTVGDHYDDSCVICADGGQLICCDNCSSTYHPVCMGFQEPPVGEWHCPYCRCKYCDQDNPDKTLLTCLQCSKKYHPTCMENYGTIISRLQPQCLALCGMSCWQVHRNLEGRLGRTLHVGDGYTWCLVRRSELDFAAHNSKDLHYKANCNAMVALSAKLMKESFNRIIDRQTKTDLIQSVVYNSGSNFTRLNFSKFYTAILEYRGYVVSVASLRMPSPEIAEIPFIATAKHCRNRGMCTFQMNIIESILAGLGAKCIVIPSADEMVEHWQRKFGFTPLQEAVAKKLRSLNTLMFPKTTRLQKLIITPPPPVRFVVQDLNLPPSE